jgi:hypothetical protein
MSTTTDAVMPVLVLLDFDFAILIALVQPLTDRHCF